MAAATIALLAADAGEAQAQEIQLTGPLAGAPAVRRLRLHREGRFEVAPQVSFTLLDEYRRTIMPGLRANYHFFDWLGVGVTGGFGLSYNAALADELQEKAINDRACGANPFSLACRRTAVNLCRNGEDCLADNQLGRLQWMVAPEITAVPFRGKFALFSSLFMDADINVFLGPAIIGLQERADCERGTCGDPNSFELASRVTVAPTFGLGFNFYANDWVGFGAQFRGTPFAWNTSGFDSGGCEEGETQCVGDEDDPDDAIDGDDSSLNFNPMLTVFVSFQLPTEINISD
jgi:hypothetical protein